MRKIKTLFVLVPLLVSCMTQSKQIPAPLLPIAMDIHSHAEPNRVRVSALMLSLELDFDKKRIQGTAEYELHRLDSNAPLVLDIQGLQIQSVTNLQGEVRSFSISPETKLGSALQIALAPADKSVRVVYNTTENAAALQWLSPAQTAGAQHPFLFTQGQAILTRTWIPMQDSPGIRIRYEATVRAPKPLTVVMSAEQLGRDADGAFRFRMPEPIPPYLIALACGELEFQAISKRCGIWAEKPVVAKAATELADTESMVQAAEKLFGPYRWGRYDILILPPSFPYGGMENPRLTFATPTILAGDKSLVALVAHELAHSWSGNLVANATWRDFWLNEGFTVYLENRIMEAVFGEERAVMERVLGRHDLEEEMKSLDPRDQVLHIHLEGRHPDDGFSQVPYEKGALFLRRLEEIFGRKEFDRFLNSYFDRHAFQSITTETFTRYLQEHLFRKSEIQAKKIDLGAWLNQPGLPQEASSYRSSALEAVDKARLSWISGKPAKELETRAWVTQQWLHFLSQMPETLTVQKMQELDEAFHFTQSHNSEILTAWLRLAIRHGYTAADPALEHFLMNVGRRKFLKPLYQELAKTPEGMARAKSIYSRARERYHSVSTGTLDKILNW